MRKKHRSLLFFGSLEWFITHLASVYARNWQLSAMKGVGEANLDNLLFFAALNQRTQNQESKVCNPAISRRRKNSALLTKSANWAMTDPKIFISRPPKKRDLSMSCRSFPQFHGKSGKLFRKVISSFRTRNHLSDPKKNNACVHFTNWHWAAHISRLNFLFPRHCEKSLK